MFDKLQITGNTASVVTAAETGQEDVQNTGNGMNQKEKSKQF